MSSDNTIDGLLMTLVSMGFDLDRSQAAVQAGKYNLQDAIEWLLQCNTTNVIPTISTPTLNLRQDRQAPVSQTQNISMHVDSSFNVIPTSSESKVAEAEAKPTQALSSRYALNEEQLADKDRWEQEQRDQVAREAKEKRLMKKKERQQILQEIEADKKARMKKMSATSVSISSTTIQEVPKGTDVTLNEESKKEQQKEKTEKKELMCTLQIRLPSGQALRHEFEASCHLQSVVEFVKEQEPALQEIELLQTFPRHVYTCEDMTHSLSELKLTPRGVLVARRSEGPPSKVHRLEAEGSSAVTSLSLVATPSVSSSVSTSPSSPSPPSVHNLSGVDVAGRLNRQMQMIADQRPPPRGHNWGAGHSLQQPDQEQPQPLAPGNVEDVVDEEMPADNDDNYELIAGWGQAQGQVGHQHPWGGGNRLDAGPLNFVYGFQEGVSGRQESVEGVSNQKTAEAALKRIELANQQPQDHPTTSTRAANIPSLVDITTKAVAKKLGDPSHSPSSLGGVPQQLAARIIDEMKKEGTLRPRTMHIFLSCHLTRCVLDCYSYATNELLHALRFHNNIHHLSLCSCSLISDAGLTVLLPSLKKLKTLKLNLNPQITDKVLEYITDLKYLTAIGLEGANITDRGVENLACLSSSLTHVNLSKTKITDASISILANLSQLRYLAVEQTQVTNLLPLQCLSNLESLHIGFTCAGSDSLVGLQKLPNLKALNLSCIHSMEGDAALVCLTGMQLRHIQLPSRHTTTDSGLQCIAGMALVELDLSDYININDDGIHHLADMTSLRKLSLSNTKTTDVGLSYLQGLTELQGLTLDRTNVTDKGVVLLGCLTKLTMLSLSSTLITSKVLKSRTLNRCHMLNKLNLSRTKVSNSGLAHLKLPNLTLLNLDYTFVTLSAANNINHCPNLKVVRANSLQVRPIDEESDSD